jgi:hypothetical protein
VPLWFEPNVGQMDGRVRYVAQSGGSTLFLTDTEAVIATLQPGRSAFQTGLDAPSLASQLQQAYRAHRHLPVMRESVIRLRPLGANPHPNLTSTEKLPGVVNEYIGSNPHNWHTGVPMFGRVVYRNIYPRIDLAYHGAARSQLEYDWIVHPGADPARIRLSIKGPGRLSIDHGGRVILGGSGMQLVMARPHVYQQIGGAPRAVSGGFALQGPGVVTFRLGAYDRHGALVIDPLTWTKSTTFIGGPGSEDVSGVKLDSQSHTIISGPTGSTTFPTGQGSSFQSTVFGTYNIFVACISDDLNTFLWVTRIGGGTPSTKGFPAETLPGGLDLDASDGIYIGGATTATDIPQVSPLQPAHFGFTGVLYKLSPGGQLLLGSTIGGSGLDSIDALAVNRANGDLFLGDSTTSSGLPMSSGAVQASFAGNTCGQVLCFALWLARYTGLTSVAVRRGAAARRPAGAPAFAGATYVNAAGGDANLTKMTVDPQGRLDTVGDTAGTLPVSSGAFQTQAAPNGSSPFLGVFSTTFAPPYYLSFANPGQSNAVSSGVATNGSIIVFNANVETGSGQSQQITGHLGTWPVDAATGFPTGQPNFQPLTQIIPILPSNPYSVYGADVTFVRGLQAEDLGQYQLSGIPVLVGFSVIPTAGAHSRAGFQPLVIPSTATSARQQPNAKARLDLAPAPSLPGDAITATLDAFKRYLDAQYREGIGIAVVDADDIDGDVQMLRAHSTHADVPPRAAQPNNAGGADAFAAKYVVHAVPATATPTPTATPQPKKKTLKCKKGYKKVKKKGKQVCQKIKKK